MSDALAGGRNGSPLPLSTLGPRIMLIGPAGAGKSTLAHEIAGRLGIPAVHLDLLFHQPDTDWVPRPAEEFASLQAAAIAEPSWVMEGNYRIKMAPRLERATGLIWLDPPLWSNLGGYLQRSLGLSRQPVPGRLPGGGERIKWLMVRHILFVQPRNRDALERVFSEFPGQKLRIASREAALSVWG